MIGNFRKVIGLLRPKFYHQTSEHLDPYFTFPDYRKIWGIGIFVLAGAALLPLMVVTLIYYQLIQKSVDSELVLRTERVTSNARRAVTFFLEERLDALRFTVNEIKYDQLTNPTHLEEIFRNLKLGFGGLKDLSVIDHTGIQISYAGPFKLEGKNYNQQAWFIECQKCNFYVSEMVPFSGGADDGRISLDRGWDPTAIDEISPVDPLRARAVDDPNPPAFLYSNSIAYYNNYLIYAGDDGKIYGYNLDSSVSVVISDTSALSSGFTAVQGFLVSSDGYLYFHDNAVNSNTPQNVYRLQLSATWPVAYDTLVTGANSAIFAFAENPWTNTIWFSSSDFFGSGNNFYLYEIDAAFTMATLRSTFAQQHSNGGNGPIIFEDETTLLYGEAVFGGDGYFHRVDTTTGSLVQANYLTFGGGLGDASYGYDNGIYVTSGGGNSIFEVDGTQQTMLATTNDEARGIIYDGTSFFISAMVPFSGSADDGEISLLQLWRTQLAGVPADQRVDDTVDLNEDGIPDNQQPDVILSANTADGSGSKQIGVSPVGTTVVVESLESVAASTISETANRPEDFPFDLVNYRLTVTSPDGTAQVTVYLSEPAPADAKWYKYDTLEGWIDYYDHATFSADRKSVTLELKDGDYGDLDRIVNGEIVDPGGVGVTASTTPVPPPSSSGGGGGGGCFIDSAGHDALKQNCSLSYLLFPMILLLGIGIFVRLRRERF